MIGKKIDIIISSEFFKSSAILILGSFFAQVFPFLMQPFLRRIFTPDEFGIAALYLAILSILTIIASLNYSVTIVLPKSDDEASYLVRGSVLISFTFSIILFLFILLLGHRFIRLMQFSDQLYPWLFLLPFSVFINSSHLILGNWLTRKKAFRKLSVNKISRRFSEGGAQLFLGKYFNYGGGLILGSFIGDFTNFITYLFQYKFTSGSFKIQLTNIKNVLIKYINFPKKNLLANLFSAVSLFVPVLMVSSFFHSEVAGQFDLSRQVLSIPLSLISLSVSQVFMQKISELKNSKKSIKIIFNKLFIFLVISAILFILPLFFYGKELFILLFGVNWIFAAEITSILVFGYAIKFIVAPLSVSLIVLEELRINSIWQFSYFAAIISLCFFNHMPFKSFILLYLVVDIVFYNCYLFLIIRAIKKYETSI